MKFIISTTIEDVLFKGRVRVKEKKLNDFLTRELDGRGVVDKNRSVLLKEFFKDPKKYIRVKGVLKEIQASDAYLRMERAVREEIIFEEDRSKLRDKGVNNLLGWSEATAEIKASVHEITRSFLDAALEEVRNPTTTGASEKMEGYYESVYNARWSHVVELPDSKKKEMGMEVHEGKPKKSWTYKKVGDTLERNDGVQKSGAARPRLMVLTSDRGWPYTWNTIQDLPMDVFVNCEVERAWRIVRNDLTEWFSPHPGTYFTPKQRLLIGTPGIGKPMAAGSYLYQLLHYDAEQLPMVAYVIGSQSFLFDKTTKTVSTYRDNPRIEDVVNIFFFPWG
ncbi:putative retrotransposon hot spot protein (RHS) [Trypanosoma cruzi]|uniref:Putative retrotransposon hot spot protein (RHS) n=1 Tax=Trypanosoma cruzi TaxID=5693 RepID=A0A2V2W8Z0_TRYCR|nr:putative retrotransposon hot spot protein (RHS) [Trypanosoma cruzi]